MKQIKVIPSAKLSCFFILLITSLFSQLSTAEIIQNETIVNKNNQTLKPHGIAINRLLRQEIYFAVLYTEDSALTTEQLYSTSISKRMSMKFIQDSFSARQFTRLWKERIAINNHRSVWQPYSNEIIRFSEAMSHSYIKGDKIDIDFISNDKVQVIINDTVFFESFELDIFNLFLATWIGDIPPTKDFKQGILGLLEQEQTKTLFNAYNVTSTISGRIALNLPKAPLQQPSSTVIPEKTVVVTKIAKVTNAKPKTVKPETKADDKELKVANNKPEEPLKKQNIDSIIVEEKATITLVPDVLAEIEPIQPASNDIASVSNTEYIDLDLMRGEYVRQLIDTIRKKQVFPSRAWRLGVFGDGIAIIKVNVDGEIINREIYESTGHKLLDRAILSLIDDSDKLPKIPKEFKEESFEFTLPISYSRS